MNIALYDYDDQQKERFVNGFAAAARPEFPLFDADRDELALTPWSRPWETEPVVMIWQGAGEPTPETLGRHWFWIVRREMLRKTRLTERYGSEPRLHAGAGA